MPPAHHADRGGFPFTDLYGARAVFRHTVFRGFAQQHQQLTELVHLFLRHPTPDQVQHILTGLADALLQLFAFLVEVYPYHAPIRGISLTKNQAFRLEPVEQ